jgi:hypothetical protein
MISGVISAADLDAEVAHLPRERRLAHALQHLREPRLGEVAGDEGEALGQGLGPRQAHAGGHTAVARPTNVVSAVTRLGAEPLLAKASSPGSGGEGHRRFRRAS